MSAPLLTPSVTINSKLASCGKVLLASHPTPKLENHPLSAAQDSLANTHVLEAVLNNWRSYPPSAAPRSHWPLDLNKIISTKKCLLWTPNFTQLAHHDLSAPCNSSTYTQNKFIALAPLCGCPITLQYVTQHTMQHKNILTWADDREDTHSYGGNVKQKDNTTERFIPTKN
jgi:hypothetical protein